ncbi:DMT family transporter [Phyllobacterium endophyticum]|uniref:EamA family transporter n=1 Tax=Phyllobacterium endophyticum TaxID=1149773 RepID=A0A2P7B2H4_9HYPH|nr:DMT family transporter [Phyllobacterium endophyticum]MBB3235484.1 drug/metabolite transporter (DMT)-like permease [Phyllobacterium endophyticum]PSH60675.1 EamA family transporter [Phyllobacterium endophyticum]TXR50107.1 DMT family transporter [Phyllobacterium endophyticum]TYR42022.1 DMT family transporter [Phyllobacterium endophyticum]
MTGSLTAILLMAISGREASRELNVFQIMEMRSVIGLAMLYPLIRSSGGFRAMSTSRIWQHLGRNTAHYAGQFAWLQALSLIPLAQVIAIEFTTPAWTAVMAVAFLGERLNVWRILTIVLGIVGVIIIVRPGIGTVELGQIIVLGAALTFGISFTMVKSLTRTDSVVKIIFWMLVIQSAIGLLPALYEWKWPSLHVMPWVVIIAFTGTFSHFCMAKALQYADATVVIPMDFLRVPLTAVLGWLIYSERIDVFTAVGAALILSGNLLNLKNRSPASIGA